MKTQNYAIHGKHTTPLINKFCILLHGKNSPSHIQDKYNLQR